MTKFKIHYMFTAFFLSLFFCRQIVVATEDIDETTKCCASSIKATTETPTGMFVCDTCTLSQGELLAHFNEMKAKKDEIQRLHSIISDQAKEIETKDDKIQELEKETTTPTPKPIEPIPSSSLPVPSIEVLDLSDDEKESGKSFDWAQYRAREAHEELESKYKSALKESATSYRHAGTLLQANKTLEDDLEYERQRFLKAKEADERAKAERQRQEEARQAEARRKDTTAHHLEEGSKQVVKEAARIVHQTGNVGKKILKKF